MSTQANSGHGATLTRTLTLTRQIAVTAHVHRMLAARAYNSTASHGAFATWMWPPSQRTPVGAPDFSMYDAPPP